jgi:rod shape determining protein RodA
MEGTTDRRAKMMIGGMLAILFSQVFINIGMTFGLMPIAGLTLPFVSYGGSSLISTFIAIGIIQSIKTH